MAWRRVYDHARRFVDDREVVVLVHDLQRNRLCDGFCDVGLRNLEIDDSARHHAVGGIRRLSVDPHHVALDQARGGRPAEVLGVLGEKAVQPRGRGLRDQAGGLRYTDPAMRATTPMLTPESATLNTGQKWKLMKSVTVPNMIRSYPLPSVPPMIRPSAASVQRSPGLRAT